MRAYLDVMDEAAEERPAAPRMLAALGDGMLRLAAERALGAHSYFVPVAHTARAREVLGPEPVLAVEQGVLLTEDPSAARAAAREWAVHYLELPNYANNWRRLGFGEDDVAGGGSDRCWTRRSPLDPSAIVDRVRAHLAAVPTMSASR